ncbi:hypothetical protein D3C85_1268680 [compost metagenome]
MGGEHVGRRSAAAFRQQQLGHLIAVLGRPLGGAQQHGEVAHHQVRVLVEEGAVDGDRPRRAVADAQQRVGQVVEVDQLAQARLLGDAVAAGEADEDGVHLATVERLQGHVGALDGLGARAVPQVVAGRVEVDQGRIGGAQAHQRQRGDEAVLGGAALEVDQCVAVARNAQALALEVGEVLDAAVGADQDALVLVEPGDAQHHGVLAVAPGPDRRDVAALAEQARLAVVVVRVADFQAVGIAQ